MSNLETNHIFRQHQRIINNPKVSFIPHSLTKNTSAKITVSLKGNEISSQIIKLKPGQYTKL